MRRGGRAHTALAGTGMVKWDPVRGAGPTQRGGARHLNHKRIFFRPTPDGSRQVVYQAGKTIAFCKFTELRQWQHQS